MLLQKINSVKPEVSTIMKILVTLLGCVVCLYSVGGNELAETPLTQYITTFLNHFQQDDPVGAPIVPIPDPLDVPPLTNTVGLATMKCSNVSLHGLSKFRIDYIQLNLVDMQVQAGIKLDSLNITGNYTLKSFMSRSKGNFTIHLLNVTIEVISGLEVQQNDQLEAQEITTMFFNENITMEFTGLGLLEKNVIDSSGASIFESSKPFMVRELNAKLREDINAKVRSIPQKFPKPVAPIDQVIAKARAHVRANFEPLKLEDFEYATTITKTELTHTWLYGLSNFQRMGDVTFELRNKTIVFKLDVGAESVNGSTQWEVTLMDKVKRAGTAAFSLDNLGIEITVSQSINTRKPPHLEEVHLTLGEIHIGFNGAGVFDVPVVMLGNLLPHLLNQQIVGCLELMLKIKLRQIFGDVVLDEVILGNLSKIDYLQKNATFFNFMEQ